MRIDQIVQKMKQFSGRLSSGIYASLQDTSNPHHVSFLRQIQKEMNQMNELDLHLNTINAVIFDFETTGFYPDRGDEIISIGAIKSLGNKIERESSFYSLVSTEKPLPDEIIQLTGITQNDIESAPLIPEVLTQFLDFCRNHVMVAHHAQHEQAFLKQATLRVNRFSFQRRIIDTSLLMKLVSPNEQFIRLEDCCSYFGIDISGRHHALEDAKMTAELWVNCIAHLESLGFKTLRDIYERLATLR